MTKGEDKPRTHPKAPQPAARRNPGAKPSAPLSDEQLDVVTGGAHEMEAKKGHG